MDALPGREMVCLQTDKARHVNERDMKALDGVTLGYAFLKFEPFI